MSEPQKFFRGQRVMVDREKSSALMEVLGIPDRCEAIVSGSYTDFYESANHKNTYQVLFLPFGRDPFMTAWIDEAQFVVLLSDDRVAGEKLLQEYKQRK